MELIVICSYQFYYSRAKVNIFPNTTKIFGKIFNRSETVVTPMYLPCKSHFYHKIIHRLSIGNPSILHRFDGQTMEMRWSNDGVSMEEQPIKNEGRNDLWHRGKQPFANMFVYFFLFSKYFWHNSWLFTIFFCIFAVNLHY